MQNGVVTSKHMKYEKLTWYTLYGLLIGRNQAVRDPVPSVDDIARIAENVSEENAIFIAKTEIGYLDELSLDGDIPEDVSDGE